MYLDPKTSIPGLVKRSIFNKIQRMRQGDSSNITDKNLQKLLLRKNTSKFVSFEDAMKGFQKHSQKIALKFLTEMGKRMHRRSSNLLLCI